MMTRMVCLILTVVLAVGFRAVQPAAAQPVRVPPNYVLGPGDVLEIGVERNEDLARIVTVRADGTVRLPLVGPVVVAGLTIQQVEARLTQLYRRYVKNAQVTVNLVQPRKIRVAILGQTLQAGVVELPAGSTVRDAVIAAGGLPETADARLAYLIRNGRELIPLDLQDILKGGGSANVLLQDGDVIVIPQAERIVVLGDGIARQGTLTPRAGLTLLDVLFQFGGVTERVSLKEARLIRNKNQVVPVNWEALLLRADVSQDVPVLGGDIIIVPEDRNKEINVFVMGFVRNPGAFPFRTVRTAYQALIAAGGPSDHASLRNSYIIRRNTGGTSPSGTGGGMIKVDLEPVFLRGDMSKDVPLQAGDVLFVPEQALYRLSALLSTILSILSGLRIVP